MEGIIKGYHPETGMGFMAVGSERILFEKSEILFATKPPAVGVSASFDITGAGDERRAVSIILDDCEEPERFLRIGRARFLPSQIQHYGIQNVSRAYLESVAEKQKLGKRDPLEKQIYDLLIGSPNYGLAQEGSLEALHIVTKQGEQHVFYETEFDIFSALEQLDAQLCGGETTAR